MTQDRDRLDRIEAALDALRQRQEASQAQLDAQIPVTAELRTSVAELKTSVADLRATSEALLLTVNQHQENFEVVVTEIRRIWEYLLRQSGNGRGES